MVEDLSIVGIDPGLTGGICFLSNSSCLISKVPTRVILKNNKKKKDYDVKSMSFLMSSNISIKNCFIFQELTHAMPGNGGVSMYSFGRGNGIWEGISSCFDVSYNLVTPQTWKKLYPEIEELKKNNSHILDRSKIKKMHKQKAIEIVKRLFPDKSSEMCKTCDGLAESCLIALYGWFKITGEKHKIMNN